MPAPRLEPQPDGSILLWIKAVPGASRSEISGVLGDRLKIRVAAPPEGGKANEAIRETLARALKIKPNQIAIHSGASNPEKILRISGIAQHQILERIRELVD